MLHNIQDIFIKETDYLQGPHFVLFNLARQFYLSLAQVLSLQTMILIRRILSLLIILLI